MRRQDENQSRKDDHSRVDDYKGLPVKLHRHKVEVVGLGIEVHEVKMALQQDDADGQEVACHHTFEHETLGHIDEYAAHLGVSGAESLEYAYGVDPLEDYDEEARDEGKGRHTRHQYDDYQHIGVEQIEPVEILGTR